MLRRDFNEPTPPKARERDNLFKRAFDVVGSAGMMVVTAPITLGIALAIRIGDGSPVLFRQARPGLHGQVFTLYKFRTMRTAVAGENPWTTDAQRVTRFGAWLRRTSLDELPELWNVLRGDMSLVGPRPLLTEYLDKYSPNHSRRHLVRPGITGLAQVSGRRRLTFSQRLDLDVHYVDNMSFPLDIKILLMTLLEPFRPGSDESQAIEEVDDLGFLRSA